MAKTPTPEELELFIEMYNRRREIKRIQEEEERRKHSDDVYGVFAKYQKKRLTYRGK